MISGAMGMVCSLSIHSMIRVCVACVSINNLPAVENALGLAIRVRPYKVSFIFDCFVPGEGLPFSNRILALKASQPRLSGVVKKLTVKREGARTNGDIALKLVDHILAISLVIKSQIDHPGPRSCKTNILLTTSRQ